MGPPRSERRARGLPTDSSKWVQGHTPLRSDQLSSPSSGWRRAPLRPGDSSKEEQWAASSPADRLILCLPRLRYPDCSSTRSTVARHHGRRRWDAALQLRSYAAPPCGCSGCTDRGVCPSRQELARVAIAGCRGAQPLASCSGATETAATAGHHRCRLMHFRLNDIALGVPLVASFPAGTGTLHPRSCDDRDQRRCGRHMDHAAIGTRARRYEVRGIIGRSRRHLTWDNVPTSSAIDQLPDIARQTHASGVVVANTLFRSRGTSCDHARLGTRFACARLPWISGVRDTPGPSGSNKWRGVLVRRTWTTLYVAIGS